MVGIGVQHPGKFVDATTATNLYKGFGATSNIIFAYGKFPAYVFTGRRFTFFFLTVK